MKRVSSLVEKFLSEKSSTFSNDRLPIKPNHENYLPIKPTNKWTIVDKRSLQNKYLFQDNDSRDLFLVNLIGYEKVSGHRAKITIEDLSIEIEVRTKDIDIVTNIDKEYARKCDLIYKNIYHAQRR